MALYFLSSTILCSLWSELFPNFYLLSFLYIYLSPILPVTPRRLSIHSIHSLNTCILWIHTFSQYIRSLSTYVLWVHTFSQYIHSFSTDIFSVRTSSQHSLGKSKSSRVPCHCQRERVHLYALCRLATLWAAFWAAVLLSWEPHWGIILLFYLCCVMQAYWRLDCALPDFPFETLKCQPLSMSYHGAVVLEWS